jgi:hypothetical protein
MRSDDILEQCLQTLTSGQELPPDVVRYLHRHPELRDEIEELLFIAQRASSLPSAELSPAHKQAMQRRLEARLGFDPTALDAPAEVAHAPDAAHEGGEKRARKKRPLLSVGRLSIAKLRYEPPDLPEDVSEARIREVFRDLTPEDIRRYIGVRGEDYLYYRQRFPGWEPVFAFIAAVLRGFKRLEKLTSL